MKRAIAYRAGYKYQLEEDYVHKLPEAFIGYSCEHYWFSITNCVLVIRKGYAWDGPSGLSWDDATGMRGSLVHDALYQAMQAGLLPPMFKGVADSELRRVCLEDGMWRIRAWYWHRAVHRFGGQWTKPGSGRPIIRCGVDA